MAATKPEIVEDVPEEVEGTFSVVEDEVIESAPEPYVNEKDAEADKALAGIKLLLDLYEAVDGAQRLSDDERELIAAVRRGIVEWDA